MLLQPVLRRISFKPRGGVFIARTLDARRGGMDAASRSGQSAGAREGLPCLGFRRKVTVAGAHCAENVRVVARTETGDPGSADPRLV